MVTHSTDIEYVQPITAGSKKLGVQWLIEHPTSHQHLWCLDSFVLRNPQLLKPAKRWQQAMTRGEFVQ